MADANTSHAHSPTLELEADGPRPESGLPPSVIQPLESLWHIDLRERRRLPEWMDQPDVEPQALQSALRALERYNRISTINAGFWGPIRRLAKCQPQAEIRVLDVACGGGDIAVNLARAAQRSRLNITVDGCDLSPTSVAFATNRAQRAGVPSRFFQFDVTQDAWPTGYDVICSSLFLHHLPTPMVETVLCQMAESAQRMVLINDLIRSRLGYLILRIGTLIMTRSPLARYDGPVSVAGAFTIGELKQMAARAGLSGARVNRCWAERMKLVWNKS